MTKLTQRLSRSDVGSDGPFPVVVPSELVAGELAGEKPASVAAQPLSVVQRVSREEVGAGAAGSAAAGSAAATGSGTRSGSAKPGAKIRKEKGAAKKKTGQKAEERDCVVM